MAKLPPSDHDDEKPRNKRRYLPREPRVGGDRERGVPRKAGGRPHDEDEDWDDDWDLDDDVEDDALEDDDLAEDDLAADDWDGEDLADEDGDDAR